MGRVKDEFIGKSEDLAKEFDLPFAIVQELGFESKDDDDWRDRCKRANLILTIICDKLVNIILYGEENAERRTDED